MATSQLRVRPPRRLRAARLLALLAAVATVAAMLAACGGGAPTGGQPTAASGESAKPVEGRVQPVADKPDKPVQIAMVGISNNPFWDQVRSGYDRGAAVLSGLGAKVEFVDAGSTITSDQIGQALNGAIAQGATSVAVFAPDDGICSYIRRATQAGITVADFNADASCAQASGSLFFRGQDLKAAGGEAAKQMCEATKGLASADKPGAVGIATQSFTLQALELRRLGFIEGLQQNCPWVTPVNQGVEYGSSNSALSSQVGSFIGSTPNLVGIYVTGGNPFVAGQAVAAAGKTDAVKVVAFDLTPDNAASVKRGEIYALLGQDPFGQSYDTLMWLYNHAVTGKAPDGGYALSTKTVVATRDNVDAAMATQASGK